MAEAKEKLGAKFSFTAEDADRFIQDLKLFKDAKILDIGTGFGSLAITLAINGYRVLTGEPADDDTKYAKNDWLKNAQKVGVDHLIEFEAFDAAKMPFADNRFDAIFSLGSLHHVDETRRQEVLKECIRTTKSDGLICFFEPNQSCLKIIKEVDPEHPQAADPHVHAQGLNLELQKKAGTLFDAFVLKK
jgi:ubiquinone/menaquinone biosynthesis C-methylase UbiE